MTATNYAISWLYGEFRIARYARNKLIEEYAAPDLVESPTDFINALREARKHVQIKGRGRVSIVHEHDLHTHSFLEIPVMRRRDLEKYLQRKVEQQTSNEGELAWCYHEAKHNDGSEGVLLHMLPKRIVDTTIVTCMAMGLTPKRYVPLTEVISNCLLGFNVDKDDVVLVVALFNERAEIVVGNGDGEVLFVRELSFGMNNNLQDRLAIDINRTVRYTRQQTGKSISHAWIIGNRPDNVTEALTDVVDIEVHLDEESNSPLFWMDRAAHLPAKLSANFVSMFAQRNITKESIRRQCVWLALALLISAAAVTASVNSKVNIRDAKISNLKNKNTELSFDLDELELRISLSEQKHSRLINLQSNSLNMPSIFLLHLSNLTPSSLVLQEVIILSEISGWSVTIKGTTTSQSDKFSKILEEFEKELQSSPWNMNVSQSWKTRWFKQFKSGVLREGEPASFEIIGQLQ